MTEFQVQVALEWAEDVPVADVSYRGQQFAEVRQVVGEFRVNLYELTTPQGAVPLDGLLDALVRTRVELG